MVALCAGYLLTGSASFGADVAFPEAPANPQGVNYQETETLLNILEQQISADHIVSPPNDNAMETWQRVSRLKATTHGSPEFLKALTDFEARTRLRAAKETADGNQLAAVALNVFADEAIRLAGNIPRSDSSDSHDTATTASGVALGGNSPEAGSAVVSAPGTPARDGLSIRGDDASPASGVASNDASKVSTIAAPTAGTATHDIEQAVNPPQSPRPTPVEPNPKETEVASAQIPMPPRVSETSVGTPGTGGADRVVARPVPGAGDPAVTTPVPMPSAVRPPTAPVSPLAVFYASRGDEMLAIKDISAARKFYEYAAYAGSARAATALAKTFDAAFVAQLGIVGLKPDPALAAAWYQKAATLGDPRPETQPPTQKAATAN